MPDIMPGSSSTCTASRRSPTRRGTSLSARSTTDSAITGSAISEWASRSIPRTRKSPHSRPVVAPADSRNERSGLEAGEEKELRVVSQRDQLTWREPLDMRERSQAEDETRRQGNQRGSAHSRNRG